jgi:hypothetical protein
LWKPFARHAAWVHRAIRKLGRRPAMWGDHVLSAPKMARRYGRDVIMFDWHYGFFVPPETPRFFCDKGFEVWCAGAASNSGNTRVIPTADNLRNLRHFSAVGMLLRDRGVTGMVNTVWCPWRYLPGAVDYPIALGGHLFTAEREDPDFAAGFARGFYGFKAGDARRAGVAIRRLYETAPAGRQFRRIMTGGSADDPFTRVDADCGRALRREMRSLATEISALARVARRHGARLNDLALSARLLARLGRYAESGRDPSSVKGGKTLVKQCISAWKRDRHEFTSGEGKPPNTDHLLGILSHLTG